MRIVGVRPLGHPRLRIRTACAGGSWLVAIVALVVLIALPPTQEAVGLAAVVVFLAGWVTALVLASLVVRRGVEVTVSAGEVRIDDLRLPRAGLAVTVDGAPGGWPRRVRLDRPGRPAVVLAQTRWLVPWPGSGRGAEVLVARVLLEQLASELAGAGGARHQFGLTRSARGWWASVAPLAAAVAALAVINVLVPAVGTIGLVVAAVLDVAAVSAGVVVVTAHAWPWPQLRQLAVQDGEVRYLDVYSGRVFHRQRRSAVGVQRRRWVRPGLRSIPSVVCAGARIDLGGAMLDVAFPEPASAGDETPMMPKPLWATEPGLGDQLVAALRAQG